MHENIAVNTQIATLTALDGDGDTPTYAITAGNTNTQFAIDTNSGILTIAKAPKALNHETTPTHKLTIQAADGNGKTEDIIATINVLDAIPPEPAPAPAPATTPDPPEDPAEDLGLTPIPETDPKA